MGGSLRRGAGAVSHAQRHLNLLDGAWAAAAGNGWIDVHNPAATTEVVGQVPAFDSADVERAYAAAAAAGRGWAELSPILRGRILLGAAALLRERRDELARTITLEMGKTLAEASIEVDKSADFLEYYGGLGRGAWGDVLPHERPRTRAWTRVEPVGTVLAIAPWNDPLLTPARKLGPALIAGNTVLLKPASATPIIALELARALADAGLPAGVLGTVTGAGAEISDALLDADQLAAVSFTGSNVVGSTLGRRLGERGVKLLAELGGKNAIVVMADADLAGAAAAVDAAAFGQAGQRCTAASRIVVERAVAAPFLEALAAAARSRVLGPGVDPATTMGPLVSDEQRQTVHGFVERASDAGVRVVTGGGPATAGELADGHFYEPTVLADVGPSFEVWREEIFGPVVSVVEADDLDGAIDIVNSSRYGLAAAIFTAALDTADRFIDGVESGQVAVNLPTSGWDVHLPFGGFKESGSGLKEQGAEGIDFYTRTKTVVVAA
jgi:alpha-ketoglutaric semialdehyde dehydrogenase